MTHHDNDLLEERTTAYLVRLLAEITRSQPTDVDPRASFESLGLDSVMGVTATARMAAVLGPLPTTLFFEFGTLRDLAANLVTTHGTALSALVGGDGAAPGTPAAPSTRPGTERTVVRRKPLSATRWSAQAAPAGRTREPGPRRGLDIAIIGLAGRYPKARTLDEFWDNLSAGRDCVTEIPPDRWDQGVYFDPEPGKPGRSYSRWGGFLDGVDEFDPLLFAISPADARLMDPQERLFLQCVHEAVEDAGCTAAGLNADGDTGHPATVGVYVGVMYEEYQLYGAQEQVLGNPLAVPGNISSVANRVSYSFDFRGPSMGVDTMCSSSLTAIHLACQAIRSGACDVAVAGGVNVSVHPNKYLLLSQGRFASSTGRCGSFGEGGDGYVPGEGVGAVLLKPLARAVRDRDRVHGVIRGVTVNHGGRTNGYAVPSPVGQARVVAEAWRQAGIDPRAMSYVEAHGTGTALGDPIEIAGLTRAFREHTRDDRFCAIGSVKSNIGHAESAAGISGLTKVLLQLRHGRIAPSLHAANPNPNIDFDRTPFTVQQTLTEWRRPVLDVDGTAREFPRIAGISSFGAGGSNAHLVVEEFRPEPATDPVPADTPVAVVLSARTAEQLADRAARLADWIERKGLATADLPELAHTLQVGREAMRERLGLVVDTMPELLARLRGAGTDGEGLLRGRAGTDTDALARLAAEADVTGLLAGRDLTTLVGLWVEGVAVDWSALHGDRPPARIALPTYPFARDRYWLDISRTTAALAEAGAASRAGATTTPARGQEPLLFTETWESEALTGAPPAGRGDAPRTLVCLCADPADRDELARAARDLDAATTLVFVVAGTGFAATAEHTYAVDAGNLDDCVGAFADIRSRYGAVDAVVNLWALAAGAEPGDYTAVLHVLRAIATAGLPAGRVLQAGAFRDGVERAYLESWLGFERSLGRVLPGLRFTAVLEDARDTGDRTSAGAWFTRMWHELSAQAGVSALYRSGVRHVSRVRPVPSRPGRDRLRQGGTYLVTGGAGGLGLLVAEHLAATRSARLVLTGRSPLDADRERRVARIEALGGEVLYVRADIADRQAMAAVVAAARARFGPIHGLVHAAGVAESGSLLTHDAGSFRRLLSAKVDGTRVLDDVLAGQELDFVCYFSSTSAVLGDFGGCGYAVGNRFQTAYAQHRDERVSAGELPGATVAIAWPLWRQGGMGFDDAQGAELYLSASGQRPLDTEEGLAVLEHALGRGPAHQIVMAGDPDRVRRVLGVDPAPPARAEETPALPVDGAAHVRNTEQVNLETLFLADLGTAIAGLLRVPPEQIHADEDFSRLGFDSVSLAKLAGALSERLPVDVLPSVFFSHPTPQRLADHLVAEHADALGEHYAPPAAPSPAPSPSPATPVAAAGDVRPAVARQVGDAEPEPIAVIGTSGRFPAARSVDEFWLLLTQGRDALSPVPPDRRGDWGDAAAPERVRCGFVPGIAEFDPAFFEISPREARSMDPRQRLLLAESWRALEDAGYGESRLSAGTMGMFLGAEQGDYSFLTGGQGSLTAQHEAIMAARLAYFLDFSGPVLAVNTACSSSLAAAHQACTSLRGGECDTAVVAGVNLATTARGHVEMGKAGMLSASGVCRAFDRRADGLVLGEAVAVVVLKRLSRAEADGDRVLAVIRGSGMNYDGRTNGITAPSGAAQARLYRQVYQRHGIDPARVEHVVAHGTGTRLGDPVEVNALNEAYREHTGRTGPCALTSTKSSVGHTLAASGLVSLIALVESVRHGVIPASPHCEEDSDYIAWADSPFVVNKATGPWQAGPTGTRLGAVSSFGMSGTNVHVVVESYPEPVRPARAEPPAHLLLLSAKTPAALAERVRELRETLTRGEPGAPPLVDVAYTLMAGRHHFAHRCALVVHDTEDAAAALASAERGAERPAIRRGEVARDLQRSLLDIQSRALVDVVGASDVPPDRYREACHALADLYCRGADPAWPALFAGAEPRFTTLPGYPFARDRHWATDELPAFAGPAASSTVDTEPVPAPGRRSVPSRVDEPATSAADGRQRILLQGPEIPANQPMAPVGKPRNVALRALRPTAPAPDVVRALGIAPASGVDVPVERPAAPAGNGGGSGRAVVVLRRELRAGLAAALFLSEGEVDVDRNFVELGLDSIIGVEWVRSINREYGTSLTATRLYDYPSVGELAAFLAPVVSGAPEVVSTPVGPLEAVAVPVESLEAAAVAGVAVEEPVVAVSAAPAGNGGGSGRAVVVLRRELRAGLAAALFLSEGEVDVDRNFVELGLDSIIGVEWVRSINREYGTSLTATRLYDYPSVGELAAFLAPVVSVPEAAPIPAEPSQAAVTPVEPPEVRAPAARPVTPAITPAQPEPVSLPERRVPSRLPEQRHGLPAASAAPRRAATARAARRGDRAAVIGMSGRYPDAENLRQYWANLRDGRDCVREVPADRWDMTRYYDPRPGRTGKSYCDAMGYLADADCFDPLFFNISPAEAEGIDPQHRLFLQEAYRAFEDAGYHARSLSRKRCGVYLGVSGNEYSFLVFGDDGGDDVVGTSNSNAIAAARIAYFLNLKGPAIALDTACSSSLVALHLAQQALTAGEIDIALVGGVSLYLLPSTYVRMSGANMLSARGKCRSFDKGADGFVPAEGVGALVLKRLSDAEADHDHIHGVVLASGTNQDGKTNGITAPSANSQMDLVRTVYDRHDIDATSIGYVEMHGTGTTLGDAIELDALGTVYRERGVVAGSCAIGSVKSNIGHTSAAAGGAGVQKVLLGMRHGLLVPSLHFETPNELLDADGCPFHVNTSLQFWGARDGHPLRRAAVSSFGFSGTNAHVVLEEYRRA